MSEESGLKARLARDENSGGDEVGEKWSEEVKDEHGRVKRVQSR